MKKWIFPILLLAWLCGLYSLSWAPPLGSPITGSGVSDHGDLDGLADDDHSAYVKSGDSTTLDTATITTIAISGADITKIDGTNLTVVGGQLNAALGTGAGTGDFLADGTVAMTGAIQLDGNDVGEAAALGGVFYLTTLEVGHASDSTLARTGAGTITIEGNELYRAGGTDVPDADVANNITIDLATVATTVTITDNESTAENNPIVFVAGADPDGGDLGLETDGTAYYTPSTGVVTATGFVGALTGAVTGEASTAAALAANPANCQAGSYARGVAADGTAENCTAASGGGDVTGVGDCTDGACLDGTADGGETIALYDGDSHKGTFDVPDISGDVVYTFPAATATIIPDTGSTNLVTVGTIATGTWEGTTVAVPQGGTGGTTFTDGGILLGSGAGAITVLGAAANGEIPIGDGTADPQLATITAGDGIDITNGAASITVTGETATDTNPGDVELATIAETNTGTDTGRAVTPDGLDGWTGSGQVTTVGAIGTGTWASTDIPVANGGTGSSTAATARAALEVPPPTLSFAVIGASMITPDTYGLGKQQVAITITDIHCVTDTGTATIKIMEGSATSPESGAGVDGSTTIVCDSDSQEDDGTLSNGTIDAGDWLAIDITAKASTPTVLTVSIYYTVD